MVGQCQGWSMVNVMPMVDQGQPLDAWMPGWSWPMVGKKSKSLGLTRCLTQPPPLLIYKPRPRQQCHILPHHPPPISQTRPFPPSIPASTRLQPHGPQPASSLGSSHKPDATRMDSGLEKSKRCNPHCTVYKKVLRPKTNTTRDYNSSSATITKYP